MSLQSQQIGLYRHETEGIAEQREEHEQVTAPAQGSMLILAATGTSLHQDGTLPSTCLGSPSPVLMHAGTALRCAGGMSSHQRRPEDALLPSAGACSDPSQPQHSGFHCQVAGTVSEQKDLHEQPLPLLPRQARSLNASGTKSHQAGSFSSAACPT
jgi:hypothetical protein